MTLNELNEIVKNFYKDFDYLKSVYAERVDEKHEIFLKYGLVKICKRDLPGDDLNRYKNLAKAVEQLEKQLEKMIVIKNFVDDYKNNVYGALAYNYYAQELSKRPKLTGKPKHFKVIKDALNEIYNNMPEEYKTTFYSIDTVTAGGHYYYLSAFFPENVLRVPEQIPVKLENPVELAENNYKAYEKIADILCNAYKDILTIQENEILTPFGQFGNMQHYESYGPAWALESNVFSELPRPLYYELGKKSEV